MDLPKGITAGILQKSDGTVVVEQLEVAATFWKRLTGLLGRRSLPEDKGFLIYPCSMVHMFFMRFPIDAVFCSRDNRVVHIEHKLKPWRISKNVRSAAYVIELAEGIADKKGLSIDDYFEFRWRELR